MTFKDYFHKNNPTLNGRFGIDGEPMEDVIERLMNTSAKYIDFKLESINVH